MREIVTVQVGSYANFIGSHFWNFQDELLGLTDNQESIPAFRNHGLDMDVLYRTGETQQGEVTYTPRVVSVNFQGSLGSMSSRGTLYDQTPPKLSSDIVSWRGKVATQASEPIKKNLFLQSLYEEEQERKSGPNVFDTGKNEATDEIQDRDIVDSLENTVKYWTDFSKVHYHPQSLYELTGLWIDVEGFDYGTGREAFTKTSHGEEMSSKLRFFIEECDHIQGLQFVVDDFGGFSGVASEFLENIADEYANVPVLLYSVRNPVSHMNTNSQKLTISESLHDAISFSRLSPFCKLIVPVGLPTLSTSKASKYLCIEDQKLYHSSAVYASAFHTISLPFRMEQLGPTADSTYAVGALDMSEGIQLLIGQGRQNTVATLDVAMPAPSLNGGQFEQYLLQNLQPLTPEVAEDVEDSLAIETMSIHGILGAAGQQETTASEVKLAVHAAYENSIQRPRFSYLSVSRPPLPIPLPFPSIFGNLVGQHGKLLGNPILGSSSRGSLDVHSIPMAARLRSTTAILPFLDRRLHDLRRFGIQRGAVGTELLGGWGFGKDELEDIGESLSKMVSTLNPHSDYSSDSD